MITIKPLLSNPFIDHSQLLDIWPPASSEIMQEITLESLEDNEPAIFLIYHETQVIGITGYFLMSEDVEYVGLRWHGIIKTKRGFGYSKEAMILVLSELKYMHPHAEYIVEYLPLTDYSDYIAHHFLTLGYEKFEEPLSQDWTPHMVQGYRANINQFLYKNIIENEFKK